MPIWYHYRTVEGLARAVDVRLVSFVREDRWQRQDGGYEPYVKLLDAQQRVLARVPGGYPEVMEEIRDLTEEE